MRHLLLLPLLLAVSASYACSDDSTDAGNNDAAVGADAAADAGPRDSGNVDSGTPDAGSDAGLDAGAADTGTSTTSGTFPRFSCAMVSTGNCREFKPGEENDLIDATNTLANQTTIVLSNGRFTLDNALTIRGASGVTLTGQGMDETILDFAGQTVQSNGVDVVGDDFTIDNLTISDAKANGLRVEDSTNVIIRRVRATWSAESQTSNGNYGLYPVRSTNVLMEYSEAFNASDAGLYVGQCRNVIVRRNTAKRNVAGLEIENTEFADVYDNLVEDNAGGLLIFDLPGNPVIGRDIRIHDNIVLRNNRSNFAASGTTVSQIPRGTGTFALASRRVEIDHNTYTDNLTTDVAILNGLAIVSSTTAWALPIGQVVGSTTGIVLINTGTHILNFQTTEIYIHQNTHSGGGLLPDAANQTARPLGVLLALLYFDGSSSHVDTLLYDGIGENVDPAVPANNTNLNHLCIDMETSASYATLDLPKLAAMIDANDIPTVADIYRPAEPFAPFNCTGFTNGPLPAVTMPFPVGP